MAGQNTANSDSLIRSEIWSAALKEVLLDSLEGTKYVNWLTEFPDGNQFTIPSIGQFGPANDYVEDQQVQYSALDTGEFAFTINTYLSEATYITNKAKQDLFYMNQLVSGFVPKMHRSIMERLEVDILKEGQPKTGNPAGYQVAGNANQINGADHRWVGSQTVNSVLTLGPSDFAKARYSLQKANVPLTNLVAIVDPSVEFVINTMTGLKDVTYNPKWEGIIAKGVGGGDTGMRFVVNIYGFDVYTSNRLAFSGTAQTGASETINSVASGTNAVCNLFFSATQDVLPFMGAWRQMPNVDAEYNKDFQREEYVTTCRYGLKIYRPENLVTVLSSRSAVY